VRNARGKLLCVFILFNLFYNIEQKDIAAIESPNVRV
jgi:hypothetical protein